VALHEELREGVAAVIVHDMDPLDREGAMGAQRWQLHHAQSRLSA
jgi:hypothetical protein